MSRGSSSILMLMVATAVTFAACSTTHHVARPTSPDAFRMLQVQGGPVDIIFRRPPVPSSTTAPIRVGTVGGFESPARPVPAADDSETGRVVDLKITDAQIEGLWIATHGSPTFLKFSDVQGFEVKRHRLGALEGAGLGLLVGIVGGSLMGYLAGDDPVPPPCMGGLECLLDWRVRFTAADKAVVGGIVGTFIGPIVGAIAGASVGHTDRYLFD